MPTVPTLRHTFRKAEHLCLQSEIEALFAEGLRGLTAYPLRMVVRAVPYDGHGPRVKVMVSVAKRRLRHAVDRNRAKRQLREAYRLRKEVLAGALAEGEALHVAFVWLADRPQPTPRVARAVAQLLERCAARLHP